MKWYARTTDIDRMGPYKSQAEAADAIMVVKHTPHCEADRWPFTGKCAGYCIRVPAEGAMTWPEETPRKRKRA